MKYLLDSNICIHFFRGQFELIDKVQEVGLEDYAISEITLAELAYGAESSAEPTTNFEVIDNFVAQVKVLPIFNAIGVYAKEKARLRKQGRMISDIDILIGSTSIANELIMVTENVKDSKGYPESK